MNLEYLNEQKKLIADSDFSFLEQRENPRVQQIRKEKEMRKFNIEQGNNEESS